MKESDDFSKPETVFWHACCVGSIDLVRELLSAHHFDLNAPMSTGEGYSTPLDAVFQGVCSLTALRFERLELKEGRSSRGWYLLVVRELLKHGLDPMKLKNDLTPLERLESHYSSIFADNGTGAEQSRRSVRVIAIANELAKAGADLSKISGTPLRLRMVWLKWQSPVLLAVVGVILLLIFG